jgi:hypothetical protein
MHAATRIPKSAFLISVFLYSRVIQSTQERLLPLHHFVDKEIFPR